MAAEKVIGGRYKVVGGRLGVGNFGEVRLGLEIGTRRRLVSSIISFNTECRENLSICVICYLEWLSKLKSL